MMYLMSLYINSFELILNKLQIENASQYIINQIQMSTSQAFKALSNQYKYVGKKIKSTKKRYNWRFMLANQSHQLICFISALSGKLKLLLDGRILLVGKVKVGQPFEHSMTVNGCLMTIRKVKQDFQFFVNNQNFNELLGKQRSQGSFKNQQGEVQDVKVTQNFGLDPSKKITLNISAIGEGMKKKKNAVESENWKQMGGQQGINYFQLHQKQQQNKISSTNDGKQQESDSDEQEAKGYEQTGANNLKIQHLGNLNTPPQQQFTTMQILFGTSNNIQNTPQQQSNVSLPKQQTNKFNTMQNLFMTQGQAPPASSQGLSNQNTGSAAQNTSPNSQFSTIQALFATNQNNPNVSNAQNLQTLPNVQNAALKTQNNAGLVAEFSTIQNLFKTNAQNLPPTTNAGQSLPVQSDYKMPTNYQQFNTMRNIFATGAVTLPPPQVNQGLTTQKVDAQSNQTNPTIQLNSQLNTNNLNNIDYQNFSTMQHLFATNQLHLPPPTVNITNTAIGVNAQSSSASYPQQFSTIQNLFKTINLNSNQSSNTVSNNGN